MSRWFVMAGMVVLVLAVMPVGAQDATPEATAVMTGLIGPDEYPPDVNPLTGLEPANPDILDERRPLVIKISNWPPVVRPQWGVNTADLVWEYVVEGGVTRFSAVFYSSDLDRVGPVRSARLADIPITQIYNAMLVHSGGSIGTNERLAVELPDRNFGVGGCPPLCRIEAEGVPIEHTLFGDVAGLYERAAEEGIDTSAQPVSGMAFSAATPAGGRAVNRVQVAYRSTTPMWTWDDASETWLRSQDGAAHFDAATDAQIYADNVVILEADHIDQPVVREGYWGAVNYATDPDLTGTGRVYLLRDGQYFEGAWTRADAAAPLYFNDANGDPLPFKPGKTFVNLVPRWFNGYQLVFDLVEPATATVITENANLRTGPSTNYNRVANASFGDELTVIGRNAAGDWVQILLDDGRVVWAADIVVEIAPDDLAALPNPRSTFEG